MVARARLGALIVSSVFSIGLMVNLFLLQGSLDHGPAQRASMTIADKIAEISGERVEEGVTAQASANGPVGDREADGEGRSQLVQAALSLDLTRAVQTALSHKGYEPGPADGVPGLMTRAALMAFEYDNGLPLTASVSQERLGQLLYGIPARSRGPRMAAVVVASDAARDVIRTVQQSLHQIGYQAGAVDGAMSIATVNAIRDFEADQGIAETGRVSGRLMAQLVALASQGKLALKN